MAEPYLSKKETWKQVVGWEKWYSVSNWARVRRDAPGKSTWAGRILRSGLGSGGYPCVRLSRPGKHRLYKVHALVAAAFIGPRPEDYQINHKNTNKQDNRPVNLEYLTPKQHGSHTAAHGLFRPACGNQNGSRTHPERVARGDRHYSRAHPEKLSRGEQHWKAKLTVENVMEIRELLAEGLSQQAIARKFSVGRATIRDVKAGKTWAHLL